MDVYEKTTKVEFWHKFTDEEGKRMSFTTISQVLRDKREVGAKAMAGQARNAYSKDRFNELFSYTKSGKKRVKTKDGDIAKTYQQLLAKGITE